MQRKPNTPAEDLAIRAGIAADPDTHELTREEIKSLKPHRFGGRPKLANPKQAIKLRLDADIVQFFRSNGAGWQTRLNAALAEHVAKARRRRPHVRAVSSSAAKSTKPKPERRIRGPNA